MISDENSPSFGMIVKKNCRLPSVRRFNKKYLIWHLLEITNSHLAHRIWFWNPIWLNETVFHSRESASSNETNLFLRIFHLFSINSTEYKLCAVCHLLQSSCLKSTVWAYSSTPHHTNSRNRAACNELNRFYKKCGSRFNKRYLVWNVLGITNSH